ncbi:hypothetical protein CKO25_18940 [Thiocapsa imhoffii]|uniref:Uncharacterized protein n=2 Tax=Thiocapsa imhoffii TaxID=382777 RepID=A0A9X0WLE2_9GAMM|nr:hypothetical protein [Thiocapsa imhoffii]
MTRKSFPSAKQINGNAPKYESYKEAWARIRQAQESGFYLEAIVIEESIIADRLTSYLSAVGLLPNKHYPGLFDLVKAWKADQVQAVDKSHGDLKAAIGDEWRASRNRAVHAIVKSAPGTATPPVEDFLAEAQAAAELGATLARAVDRWHRAQLKAG